MDNHFQFPETTEGLEKTRRAYGNLRQMFVNGGYMPPPDAAVLAGAELLGHEQPIEDYYVGLHSGSGSLVVLLWEHYAVHLIKD